MDVILIVGFSALIVFIVSLFLGRAFGGKWLLVFFGVMLLIGGLAVFSLFMWASGEHAGMGEALFLIFIWAPIGVVGLIGGVFGWVTRRTPLVATLGDTPD